MKKINLNKHNVTKGIFLLALALMLSLKVYPQYVINDLLYKIRSENTVSVRKYSSPKEKLIIPEKVTINKKVYTVTEIDTFAFYNCSGIESVSLPNTITKIGYRAFEGCTYLRTINIPNSVQTIEDCAFWKCI